MKLVSPKRVLEQIAQAIPADCRENIIIIGSLATGYHFFGHNAAMMVRTKDADCLLAPRVKAIPAGVAVTERLFEEKWTFRPDEKRSQPGNSSTPDDQLPAVRLNPPGASEWFIELLTVPESSSDLAQRWVRLETRNGHFGLCSFGFLSLASFKPIKTDLGISIARPEMMVLANLLEHPKIGQQTMSGLIGERQIKRSNKDLGRVLAIAWLSLRDNEDAFEDWPKRWREALEACFPDRWRELASRAGAGLRELLRPENEPDFEEARHTCEFGLLASSPTNPTQLRAIGLRLLQDAIEPLEKMSATPQEKETS